MLLYSIKVARVSTLFLNTRNAEIVNSVHHDGILWFLHLFFVKLARVSIHDMYVLDLVFMHYRHLDCDLFPLEIV